MNLLREIADAVGSGAKQLGKAVGVGGAAASVPIDKPQRYPGGIPPSQMRNQLAEIQSKMERMQPLPYAPLEGKMPKSGQGGTPPQLQQALDRLAQAQQRINGASPFGHLPAQAQQPSYSQDIPMGQVEGVEGGYPQDTGSPYRGGNQPYRMNMNDLATQYGGNPASNAADPFGWQRPSMTNDVRRYLGY